MHKYIFQRYTWIHICNKSLWDNYLGRTKHRIEIRRAAHYRFVVCQIFGKVNMFEFLRLIFKFQITLNIVPHPLC